MLREQGFDSGSTGTALQSGESSHTQFFMNRMNEYDWNLLVKSPGKAKGGASFASRYLISCDSPSGGNPLVHHSLTLRYNIILTNQFCAFDWDLAYDLILGSYSK